MQPVQPMIPAIPAVPPEASGQTIGKRRFGINVARLITEGTES